MNWNKKKITENGKTYTDYVSEDGKWRLAQGYDDNKDWSITEGNRFKGAFKTLAQAKQFVESKSNENS